MKQLDSQLDRSINFVQEMDVGSMESRFVRRTDDYFILYVSSQTGCDQSCRMCFLTATGQVEYVNVDIDGFIDQIVPVLDHYTTTTPAKKIHINFMARGEPLNNPIVSSESALFERLFFMVKRYDPTIEVRFIVSTIMPKSAIHWPLVDRFDGPITPSIYYSLYSTSPKFRKKWLGKAANYTEALAQFKEYCEAHPNIQNKIHFAFIKDQNDSVDDVNDLIGVLTPMKDYLKMNVIRYNAFSPSYGEESSPEVFDRNVQMLKDAFGGDRIKVVPRVGMDVAASCGMFVN